MSPITGPDGVVYYSKKESEEKPEETTEETPSETTEEKPEETTEEKPAETTEEPEEKLDDKVDKAAEAIMAKLDPEVIKEKVLEALKKTENTAPKKATTLIDFEELMKKDVSEMTAKEKIVGFFQAMIWNDVEVLKALSEGTASEGGYLFPDEFRKEIIRDLEEEPHMRSRVTVIPMKRDVMKIPGLVDGPRVYWTDERAAKSTTTATFTEHTLTAYKMAAILYATDELIEDCDTVDIVQFIIGLFSEALGEEEDRVITVGTGVGQPTGYASGGLGIQCQAVGGNLGFDDIIDLIYMLPAKWKRAAAFYVHKNNVRELRKVKDSQNRYIWMDSPAPGQPSTIYGYPVIEDNNLPEAEIYFGDLKKAYYLGDRKKMTVMISQHTAEAWEKDRTGIRVVQRIAGTVVRPTGLKCLNSIP